MLGIIIIINRHCSNLLGTIDRSVNGRLAVGIRCWEGSTVSIKIPITIFIRGHSKSTFQTILLGKRGHKKEYASDNSIPLSDARERTERLLDDGSGEDVMLRRRRPVHLLLLLFSFRRSIFLRSDHGPVADQRRHERERRVLQYQLAVRDEHQRRLGLRWRHLELR